MKKCLNAAQVLLIHLRIRAVYPYLSPNQILVAHWLAFTGRDKCCHLFARIALTSVLAILELTHVAMQVVRAHAVIRAHMPALEQRPERLNAIRVRLPVGVLAS